MLLSNVFSYTTRFEEYSAGAPIFTKNDVGDSMYVVIEGQVDLWTDDRIVETVEGGGIIGELALIEPGVPRGVTAFARTDCKLVALDSERFICLVQHTPHFALEVMRVMANRLRHWSPGK